MRRGGRRLPYSRTSGEQNLRKKTGKKRLTSGRLYGNINIALRNSAVQPLARVVELVDSLASGASARKGVRVRLPPRAPVRRKRHIACDELFHFIAKLIARSFCCSSLPNRTRCAGLRFDFRYKTEGWHRSCCNVLKTVAWAGGCLSFWVPLPLAAPPFGISMPGANELPLRQGFRRRRKRLYGAYRAAPSQMGPQGGRRDPVPAGLTPRWREYRSGGRW